MISILGLLIYQKIVIDMYISFWTPLDVDINLALILGNYTCEVEWSPEKDPVTLSHYLEVCVSPSVVAINTDGGSFKDVREGDNATLECEADGIPRPSIHWVSSKNRPANRTRNS